MFKLLPVCDELCPLCTSAVPVRTTWGPYGSSLDRIREFLQINWQSIFCCTVMICTLWVGEWMSETNSCHYLSVHLNPAEAKINFISVTLTCFLLGADLLTTIPLKTFFLLDIFFKEYFVHHVLFKFKFLVQTSPPPFSLSALEGSDMEIGLVFTVP